MTNRTIGCFLLAKKAEDSFQTALLHVRMRGGGKRERQIHDCCVNMALAEPEDNETEAPRLDTSCGSRPIVNPDKMLLYAAGQKDASVSENE